MGGIADHPDHYQHGRKETIYTIRDAMTSEAFQGFLTGNIIKYISRFQWKGGVDDLQKAQWYLDFLINEIQGTSIE